MHLHNPNETIINVIEAHIAAGRHDEAAKLLRIAKCNPATQAEAQIWEGIQVLATEPQMAYRLLNSAAIALPHKAEVQVLQARAAERAGESELAHQLIENALYVDPLSPAIRIAAWRSRAKTLPPIVLQSQLLKALPDITDGSELAFVLPLLPRGPIGVIAYDPIKSELHGWAINTADPRDIVQLECFAMNQCLTLAADQTSALLQSSGLPTGQGGIRLKIPAGTYRMEVRITGGGMLSGSPLVPLAPLITPPPKKGNPREHPIDILIPVYGGEVETLACIHSVLGARKLNKFKHEIIVLEDASPEPALVKALLALAQSGAITLVQHPANLGFIRGMNRGMIMHPERDVIWLNADTLVNGNWVDRLQQAAYSAADIASVTPFSNNGELMSFPEPSKPHPMPDATQLRELDTLAAATKATPVPLNVGNGFCMYLRRKVMTIVGFLDEIHMARGYGEETDWCLRATVAGFRHVGAPNVFVAHKGAVSFGAEKRYRVKQNLRIINQRYPWAEQAYVQHVLNDPVEKARQRLQIQRLIKTRTAINSGTITALLQISEDSESTLSKEHDSRQSQYFDECLRLTYKCMNGIHKATLKIDIAPFPIYIKYNLPSELTQLKENILSLGKINISLPPENTENFPFLNTILAEITFPTVYRAAPSMDGTTTSVNYKGRSAWIIGDAHDKTAIEKWLLIARQIADQQPGTHLLIQHGALHATILQATGVVLKDRVPPNVDSTAHARATGSIAVLYQKNSHSKQTALKLAQRLNLPLSSIPETWTVFEDKASTLGDGKASYD